MHNEDDYVFTVNKNSWHFRLLDYVDWSYTTDFCSYWRRLILLCVILVALATMTVLFIWVFLIMPFFDPSFLILDGILIGYLLLTYCLCANHHFKHKVRNSIVATKYRSWKERYCPLIKYEE